MIGALVETSYREVKVRNADKMTGVKTMNEIVILDHLSVPRAYNEG